MSEQALAAWALLLRPELPELVARVGASIGISMERCMEALTPRDLLALSGGMDAEAAHHLGDSPSADAQLAGFFG